jgi:putative peptidoglycan lipid II flippase
MKGVRTADLVAILGLIPISVLVYGGVLFALRVEGREELSALIKKLLNRFGIAK